MSNANKKIAFCTSFRHYRSGKILQAKDYGYKCWPIGHANKRK